MFILLSVIAINFFNCNQRKCLKSELGWTGPMNQYQGVSFFENFFKTGLPCFFGVLWVMNNSLVTFYGIRISFRGASRRFFRILSFAWKISFMTFLTWANFLNIHPISSCNTPFSQFFQELSFEYHICIPMTMFQLSVFTRMHNFLLIFT